MTVSAWQFGDLQTFGYDVIIADPPWDFQNYSDAGTLKGADPHYQVMTLAAIKALRVGELARSACLLLLWATECMRPQAHDVMAAWGFKYKSAMVWRKITASGKSRIGTGYRVRTMHEPILLGTIGNPRQAGAFPSIFEGIAREHSRKPDEFYELVAKHTPNAFRADLFSRQTREGFAAWGDQCGKFNPEMRENSAPRTTP
jgi:N6-adenosine-specific RNA methylase IME4